MQTYATPTLPEADPLLLRMARGEDAAVQDCLERFEPVVRSLARGMTRDAASADEATQDALVDVWRSAHRYDPRAGSEATFVATIARRRLIDRHRRAHRRPDSVALELVEGGDSYGGAAGSWDGGLDALETREEARRVARVLEELRPAQRAVLSLSVEGLSHTEISERLDLPLGTVKSHARRGIIAARELLAADAQPNRESWVGGSPSSFQGRGGTAA